MKFLIPVFGVLVMGLAVSADDAAKTIERIKEDADNASRKLGEKDAGADTQRLQREVLGRIDDLIRKAKEPPPMNNDPSSSLNNAPKPMSSGSESAQQRKERREKNAQTNNGETQAKDRTTSPQPRLDPSPKLGSMRTLNNSSDKSEPFSAKMPQRITDTYKDAWGHLPEKVRQEMDLYFREQFMPRYAELLRQYYSSLAERNAGN